MKKKLSTAVSLALATGLGTAGHGIAFAQDGADTEGRVQVTGSRITRTDVEGALPVTVISREQIELSGQISVSEVLRNTTFNSSGSFRPVSGSGSQAMAQLSLRGLGSGRTLILIDGRRLATSPINGESQDLNNIPLGAVERIEILSDGASAIYGSDAIGGVVNIITRKDFQGAEVRLGGSSPSVPSFGADRQEGSVMFGATSTTSNIIGGYSWNHQDIVFTRAYPFFPPGITSYGNNWGELNAAGNPPIVNNVAQRALVNACGFDLFFIVVSPQGGQDMCSYDHTQASGNDASFGTQSLFLRAQHNFSDDWSIYTNASITRSKSFGRFAASLNDPGDVISAASPNNPTNPASPLYDASIGGPARDVAIWHRFAALGSRDSFDGTHMYSYVMGFEGRAGGVDLDFGYRHTKIAFTSIGTGYLLRSVAREAMNSGAYMLNDPFGQRFANDPDGAAAHQALLNSFNVTTSRRGVFDQQEIYGLANFDLFEMANGTARAVIGIERREELYSDQYDALSEAGVVGGSSGNSAGGGRNVNSAFFETLFPLTDTLELSVAGRMDEYSDYGRDFSPKAALRWAPNSQIVVRASYGEGFAAPNLSILTQADYSTNPTVNDWVHCAANNIAVNDCTSLQLRTIVTANADLVSENSKQYALGIAWEPERFGWMDMSLDYYSVKIDGRIADITLQDLINRERDGIAIPTGLGIVRDPVTQVYLSSLTGYANEGTVDTDGLDFNLRTTFDVLGGRLRNQLQISYVLEYRLDGGVSEPGLLGFPKYRATLQNIFQRGDWDFGWNVNVIGDSQSATTTLRYATHVTHDLSLSYNTPWNSRITIGSNNVFEKMPWITAAGAYDNWLYDVYGRWVYARYVQRF